MTTNSWGDDVAPGPEKARCGCDHLDESGYQRNSQEKPAIGCGAEGEVGRMFRCIDCGMLLCKACMKRHCAHDRSLTLTYLRLIRDHEKNGLNATIDWAAHVARQAIKALTGSEQS